MARRARSVTNAVWVTAVAAISALLFIDCAEHPRSPDVEPTEQPTISVSASDPRLQLDSGVMKFAGKLYTGYIVAAAQNGDTLAVAPFSRGKEHGTERQWYPNRQLQEVRHYTLGKKTGRHEGWWPDGKQRFVYDFDNDNFEGVVKEWYPNGALYRSFHYHEGHEQGLQTVYYQDGRIQANYEVRDGRNYGNTGYRNCESPFKNDSAARR